MSMLLRVDPDGSVRRIQNHYVEIRDAIGGPFDFVRRTPRLGAYFHDCSLLEAMTFNVVASMFIGIAIYGPAVFCRGDPDDEGETLPAEPRDAAAIVAASVIWQQVRSHAKAIGQDIDVRANPDTVPPPTFTSWKTAEEFDDWLEQLSEE